MATSTHYPPSALPWQALSYDDPDFTREWFCTLVDWRDERPICELRVTLRPFSGLWYWRLMAYVPWGPEPRSSSLYSDYAACELSMLTALAAWLHGPPSRCLPSREGATAGGKEAGRA